MSECARGHIRASCSEDPAAFLSNLLALRSNGSHQRGVHAHANDRKSVCGTSNGGKLAQRNGLAATTSTQRFVMRGGRFPGILGELTLRRRVEAEHDGSVHL